MLVRKLDENGDMTFGRSMKNYFSDDPEGVAQCVKTRLDLWRGSWFLDTTEGTPWLQQILGKHDAVNIVIQSRILGTPGVKSIDEFEAILDPDSRTLTVSTTLNTDYGTTDLTTEVA